MTTDRTLRPRRILLSVALSLASLALLAGAVASTAGPFSAKCVRVFDGDTIEVLYGSLEVRVRLEGIDAPERGQAFANRATQYLSELVLGNDVTVEPHGRDQWNRIIGRVRVGEIDASEALVGAGLAWHFERFSDDPRLARLERDARAAGIGLWSATRPTAPWDYRDAQQAEEAALTTVGPLHGNVGSGVFHRSTCEHYHCRNCTRAFVSRSEAIEAGFRPCRRCRP